MSYPWFLSLSSSERTAWVKRIYNVSASPKKRRKVEVKEDRKERKKRGHSAGVVLSRQQPDTTQALHLPGSQDHMTAVSYWEWRSKAEGEPFLLLPSSLCFKAESPDSLRLTLRPADLNGWALNVS